MRLVGLATALTTLRLGAQSPVTERDALNTASAIAVADSLFAANAMERSYTLLAERLRQSPGDYDLRWRATRAALGLGIAGASSDVRIGWLRQADMQGRELVRCCPNSPEAKAWAAAARGRRALSEGDVRLVAGLAKETWTLTGDVLRVQPDNAIANQVRGRLHQEVAHLPMVARLFARFLLGSALLEQAGRWDLAEFHLRRAISADPGFVIAYLDLGQTYLLEGKRADAVEVFTRGSRVASRYPVDELFKAEMRNQLMPSERSESPP